MSSTFDAVHYREAYPDGYADHYWHIARDRIVGDALRARVATGSTCLEIGCGRGHFVPVLRRQGYDAWGVELGTPDVLREAAPYVQTGLSFADLPAGTRESVRCVLLLDVMEHLADAPAFLAEIKGSFPKLATLVVTVPARPEIWSNYDDHYGHFRRYSASGLADELQRGGFRVQDIRYAFRSLYLAALALRWLGARRGVVHEAPRAGWRHRLIAQALLVETRLLPRFLFGSSLVCVAEPGR